MKRLVILAVLLISTPALAGIEFDATDDYVDIGATANYSSDTSGTITAWIYINNLLVSNGVMAILARGGTQASTGGINDFAIRKSGSFTGNRIDYTSADDGHGDLYGNAGSTQLSAGQWYHVATVSNGTTTNMYVNGVLETNTTWVGSNTGNWYGDNTVTGDEFRIGNLFFQNANQGYFDGIIDSVAVWNTNLSANELSIIAKSKVKGIECQIKPANIRNVWLLNEGSDGTSGDGTTYRSVCSASTGDDATGVDGANNTGLTNKASQILSYP